MSKEQRQRAAALRAGRTKMPEDETILFERLTNALPNLSNEALRETDDKINRILFDRNEADRGDAQENAVVAMASHISKRYFEAQFAPYTEAKWRLWHLIEKIDDYASCMWDDMLRDRLGDTIEGDLEGKWHQVKSIAFGAGWNIAEEVPYLDEGIRQRLIALHLFMQQGDSQPLREIVKRKLNLESLNIPQFGRPSGRKGFSLVIADKMREFIKSGKNVSDAAEATVDYFTTMTPQNDAEEQAKNHLAASGDPEKMARTKYQESERKR